MKGKGSGRLACLLLLALLAAAPGVAAGLSVPEVVPEAGLMWIGNLGPGGPSPTVGVIGASMPLALDGFPEPLFLGAAIDLFGTWYGTIAGRGVPVEQEYPAGFFTLGILLSPRIGAQWSLGPAVEAGGFLALDLLLRFPLDPFNAASYASQLPALGYFFAWRFIYPETGLFLRWRATEQWSFLFSARALWPWFHLFDGEGLPFFDQALVGATVGAAIRLAAPAAAPAAGPQPAGEPAAEPAASPATQP